MGTPVYVWPFELISAVYADLHDDDLGEGFHVYYASLMQDGKKVEKVTMEFNFNTPVVDGGVVEAEVSGVAAPGGAEAERSAVVSMVENLRVKYQFYPADFNFVAVCENRATYNAMKAAYDAFKETYGRLEIKMRQLHGSMEVLCSGMSCWLGKAHPVIDLPDTVPFHAFLSAMKEQSTDLSIIIEDSAFLVDMIQRRSTPPECQRRFDNTVPADVVVNWLRSYSTLRCVYNAAVRKVGAVFSPVDLSVESDGQFKASVTLTAEPYVFEGAPAPTEKEAAARLFYEVIKYVNTKKGCPIHDLHYRVKIHQDYFVEHFDRKMDGINRCGLKLQRILTETGNVFARNTAELTANVPHGVDASPAFEKIHFFAARLRELKLAFNVSWDRFVEQKVDTAMVKATLGQGANNA